MRQSAPSHPIRRTLGIASRTSQATWSEQCIQTFLLADAPQVSEVPTTIPAMTRAEPAFEGRRAAALAGVPLSTVYYWARSGIWPPTSPNNRPKLWSYSDLLALRLIDWLRRAKDDFRVPHTRMSEIRRMLESVEDLGEELRSDSVRV